VSGSDSVADGAGALQIHLLGPVEAVRNGTPVRIPAGGPTIVLATLALSAGRPVTVATLAARVWGDRLPNHVRASLSSLVSRLRRALGPSAVVGTPVGYLLDVAPQDVDLLRFRRIVAQASGQPAQAYMMLVEALALWRAEPLAGLGSAEMARDEAPRLIEEWLAALEQRAELDLAAGRFGSLVPELTELVGRYPLRERLWLQLLTALDGSGRPAQALAAYEDLRVRLRDTLGTDPSPQLQAAHRHLLADAPEMPAIRDSGPRNAASPPRQLPAAGRFVGRRAELAELDRLLAENPPTSDRGLVIAVDGTAGIGKTALTLCWAHRVTDRFPGGQLHVNLHGYDPLAPSDPNTVLASFLRALGMPAATMPAELDERAALLRTVTTDRGLLIVADNARDTEQVRALMPSPGNALVVTSRSQLRGLTARDGAHRVTLDALCAPEATQLVATMIGARRAADQPDAVAELVELCGHLPLAVVVAAEYVARQPAVPVGQLIAPLRAEQLRLDALSTGADLDTDLRAVFSWSLRHLPVPAAQLFRLLGLPPRSGRISLPAVAALAGRPAAAVRTDLDRLVDAHLLEYLYPDRYDTHDLLRAYAAELGRDNDPPGYSTAALDRLVSWYLHTAGGAQQRMRLKLGDRPPPLLPGVEPAVFDSYEAAIDWFDTEFANLTAIVRYAITAGAVDDGVHILWSMRIFLGNRAHWAKWIRLCELALDIGTERSRARVRSSLGGAYFYQQRHAEALPHYRAGLAHIESQPDLPEYTELLSQIGTSLINLGRTDEAITILRRVLDNRWGSQTAALINLATAYGQLGRFEEALQCSVQAMEQHTARGETDNAMRAANNVAEAHLQLGHYAEAVRACEAPLRMARQIGNRASEAHALASLGTSLARSGRPQQGAGALRQALDSLDEIGAGDTELRRYARATLAELDIGAAAGRSDSEVDEV
jgi:DNA-binding SARP family transcriptional activator